MSKHTPGPWEIEAHGTNLSVCPKTVDENGFYTIATMRGPDQDANARLIAAAPDLLAVCKRMIAQAADRNMPLTKEKVLQFVVIHEEMRAAIAKAEGEKE